MTKRYIFWARAAAMIQLITALFHALSGFTTSMPENDTEKQLYNLVNTYKSDMGFGFRRTTAELITGLGSCFTLLCLSGALTILYLLREKAPERIIKGILNIQCIIFGICFLMMAVFTFPLPIVLTGMAFISLLIARITMGIQVTRQD